MKLRYLLSAFVLVYVASLFLTLFVQSVLGNILAALTALLGAVVVWFFWATLTKRHPHRRLKLFQYSLWVTFSLLVASVLHLVGAFASLQEIERITLAFMPILLLITAAAFFLSLTKKRYRRY